MAVPGDTSALDRIHRALAGQSTDSAGLTGSPETPASSTSTRTSSGPGGVRDRDLYEFDVRCLDRHACTDGWYWSLWYEGERINGGVCSHWQDGRERAQSAIAFDLYRDWITKMIWDEETSSWYRRPEHVS